MHVTHPRLRTCLAGGGGVCVCVCHLRNADCENGVWSYRHGTQKTRFPKTIESKTEFHQT